MFSLPKLTLINMSRENHMATGEIQSDYSVPNKYKLNFDKSLSLLSVVHTITCGIFLG